MSTTNGTIGSLPPVMTFCCHIANVVACPRLPQSTTRTEKTRTRTTKMRTIETTTMTVRTTWRRRRRRQGWQQWHRQQRRQRQWRQRHRRQWRRQRRQRQRRRRQRRQGWRRIQQRRQRIGARWGSSVPLHPIWYCLKADCRAWLRLPSLLHTICRSWPSCHHHPSRLPWPSSDYLWISPCWRSIGCHTNNPSSRLSLGGFLSCLIINGLDTIMLSQSSTHSSKIKINAKYQKNVMNAHAVTGVAFLNLPPIVNALGVEE